MANKKSFELTVVYVNYNQEFLLLQSIRSLFEYNVIHSISLVVVNNSAPLDPGIKRSIASVCSKFLSPITFLEFNENIGFGKACNLGSTVYKSHYLLFLNCDTKFFDASLQRALEFMRSCDQDVGAVGCVHVDHNHIPCFPAYPFTRDSLLIYLLLSNPILHRLCNFRDFYRIPKGPTLVGDISGAFMLLATEAFVSVEGFNPEFFLYAEDTSLCRDRLLPAGFKIILLPSARIIHHVGTPSSYTWRMKQALASEMLRRYRQGLFCLICFSFINLTNFVTLTAIAIIRLNSTDVTKYMRLCYDLLIMLAIELPSFLASPKPRDFRVKHNRCN